jgi:hypothetical protein
MPHGQVEAQRFGECLAIGERPLCCVRRGRADRLGHERVAVLEMRVEAPVCQPGFLHERRDSDALDPAPAQRTRGRANDALVHCLFVRLRVSHDDHHGMGDGKGKG